MKESTRIEFNKLDPGIKEEYEDLKKRGVDFDLEAKHKRYYENTNLEFLKWRSDILRRRANGFYPLNTKRSINQINKNMKMKIKVEYNVAEKSTTEILDLDMKVTEKIESIGGKFYAQGCDIKGNRDICFDLITK